MNGSVRRHNILNRLCEETELFKETSLNDMNEIRSFLLEFRRDTEEKIKKLIAGHKQLIDWIGMQFNCYIPKDLCLLNLTLMGITVDEKTFDKFDKKNSFGATINKSKDDNTPLYNFKLVFKFFFFHYTSEHCECLNDKRNPKLTSSMILQQNARIKAKLVRRNNKENTFYFDFENLKKLNKEIEEDRERMNNLK